MVDGVLVREQRGEMVHVIRLVREHPAQRLIVEHAALHKPHRGVLGQVPAAGRREIVEHHNPCRAGGGKRPRETRADAAGAAGYEDPAPAVIVMRRHCLTPPGLPAPGGATAAASTATGFPVRADSSAASPASVLAAYADIATGGALVPRTAAIQARSSSR